MNIYEPCHLDSVDQFLKLGLETKTNYKRITLNVKNFFYYYNIMKNIQSFYSFLK